MPSAVRSVAIAGLLLMCGATAATAQIVVLNARGPSAAAYPQGAVLAPNRVIALRQGDQLEILDAAGSHVLAGPATVTAGQISSGSKAQLQDIFKRANATRPGIAAVRGFTLDEGKPATPAASPEATPLWRLDVSAWQEAEPMDSHNFCVMKGQIPVLTRNEDKANGSLVIEQEANQASQTVTWSAGARNLPWPSSLPVADGSVYDLNLDAAGATSVRWRTIPQETSSLTELASSLLANGCYDQLDTLQAQFAAK
jgi:hypothetical protein